jgi:hypothetical protein
MLYNTLILASAAVVSGLVRALASGRVAGSLPSAAGRTIRGRRPAWLGR